MPGSNQNLFAYSYEDQNLITVLTEGQVLWSFLESFQLLLGVTSCAALWDPATCA